MVYDKQFVDHDYGDSKKKRGKGSKDKQGNPDNLLGKLNNQMNELNKLINK